MKIHLELLRLQGVEIRASDTQRVQALGVLGPRMVQDPSPEMRK